MNVNFIRRVQLVMFPVLILMSHNTSWKKLFMKLIHDTYVWGKRQRKLLMNNRLHRFLTFINSFLYKTFFEFFPENRNALSKYQMIKNYFFYVAKRLPVFKTKLIVVALQ